MNSKLVTILISSAGRRVELMRSFQAEAKALGLNLRVLAVDTEPEMSPACQAADRFFQIPRCTGPEFVSDLLQICDKEGVSLVVPTIDTELQTYADHQQQFETIGTRVMISSPEIVRMARDKEETAKFLARNDVRTPKSAMLAEVLARPESWLWPIVLKPVNGSRSIGLCVANSLAEAKIAGGQRNDYLAQEQIRGPEYTVSLFFDKAGNLRSAVPHQRYEVRAGEVSKAITRRDPRLVELAWRLGSVLKGAVGTLCFQVIMPKGEQPVVFEINARFGGGYPVAHQAGATFTKWLLEEVVGLPSSANDHWEEDLAMLRYDSAFYHKVTADT